MTYLQLVNKVLIRLRESEVTSVQQTEYSKLVGEFVNDALRLVEDAWDWSALRTTLTVQTTANIFNYVLTNSGNRGKILDVVNDSSNYFMHYKDQHWFNNAFLNQEPSKASPTYYTFNGVDVNGDTQIDVYPIPNAAYTLRFNMVLRSKELTTDTDTVLIPTLPVIHMAVALATRERGENGGSSTAELFASANNLLSDAIALDASKHPEETTFMAV